MGRLISNFFISLDDVVESPDQWHFPYFDDRMGQIVGSGMEQYSHFLMGRTLYGEWSEYWPQQGPEVPFSEFINTIPKYVVSSSLDEASWNNTTILRSAEDVRRVKDEAPRDIGISGSATTVRWLMAEGLLDELQLLVHPIAVGHGRRLFEDTATFPLQLTHHEVLDTGVLHLKYAPAS